MRTQWVSDDNVAVILAAMFYENALACECSLRYGMRIGDVLALTRKQVSAGRFSYSEQKTGKRRSVTISGDFQHELLANAGRYYIFEGRSDWKKHRTRQAVYKDVKRVSEVIRLHHVGCHSFRKAYAVSRYRKYRDMARVKRLLNHSDEAVTMIYALADTMTYNAK